MNRDFEVDGRRKQKMKKQNKKDNVRTYSKDNAYVLLEVHV